jgi:hypothetical protein
VCVFFGGKNKKSRDEKSWFCSNQYDNKINRGFRIEKQYQLVQNKVILFHNVKIYTKKKWIEAR